MTLAKPLNQLLSQSFVRVQHLLPQHGLSRAVGSIAASKNPIVRRAAITAFARAYGITLDDYARKHVRDFDSFNDFFTRELDTGARTIDDTPNSIACPADGHISELGSIERGRMLQAKGMDYSVSQLLGSTLDAEAFYGGQFATVYLAPSNYHRVHMPLTATLTATRYIPGALFSVNATTAQHVPNLFARNERMVCLFEHSHGGKTHPMAVVLVGAMIVAGIETVATGKVLASKQVQERSHSLQLEKGVELGRFYLGSTAIVLLPKTTNSSWLASLSAGQAVHMGALMGALG